ncbi:MAG: bifunctional riboflavin kinase/FAD synthetase [Planctomycetota bacterium]
MRVIEGLEALLALDLRARFGDTVEGRSVVAVGVFDGVHIGHQRLLHELLEMGSELKGAPTVLTFRGHPDGVLRGKAPPLLVSVPHRLRLLRRAGVLRLLLLEFDDWVRAMPARVFAERVLARSLRTTGLLLGYDSALGRDREGTPERFRALGREFGFEVRTGTPLLVDGAPVSSSAIRTAIRTGDLDLAQRLLGRLPSVLGTVVHGDQRGRRLGFPTANVVPQVPLLPPRGVYAVQVLLDGEILPGIANLGVRPTFEGDDPVLEVHLLGIERDLYGRELEVGFLKFLRPERAFEDEDALRAQIRVDVETARGLAQA